MEAPTIWDMAILNPPCSQETDAGALLAAPGAITLAAAWIDLTMLW
jgi:hypothetical protein